MAETQIDNYRLGKPARYLFRRCIHVTLLSRRLSRGESKARDAEARGDEREEVLWARSALDHARAIYAARRRRDGGDAVRRAGVPNPALPALREVVHEIARTIDLATAG
jgi:hypothetical protein